MRETSRFRQDPSGQQGVSLTLALWTMVAYADLAVDLGNSSCALPLDLAALEGRNE